MKELNIAQVIVHHRRKRGATQEELAYFMGVSKASVSKWETGQSYPDITFLPQLASYFNISIDELIGYEPQMEKEDINKLYQHFCKEFASNPFDEVYEECREITKKYFSCFPLLLQMAYLYMNHHMIASAEKKTEVLEEARHLFGRVKTESQSPGLAREGEYGEALTYLITNEPAMALEILGEEIRLEMQKNELISQAYLMLGNTEQAAKIRQIMMYQHLLGMAGQVPQLLVTEAKRPEKIEQILGRTMELEHLFHLNELYPNTMAQIYLAAAQSYMGMGLEEKTLEYLEYYAELSGCFFPLFLHGDAFFDRIDGWLKEECSPVPRDEKLVKESIYQGVAQNPFFASLKENKRYKNVLRKLEQKMNLEG